MNLIVNDLSRNREPVSSLPLNAALDERQRRERDYHAEFAKRHHDQIAQPVSLAVLKPGPRRPWNAHWTVYDLLLAEPDLVGKRAMVPGCGFGDDAIRLATLGLEVHAYDLSEDILAITRRRAEGMGVDNICFDVMPAEALAYPDDFFDLVYFNDILHHVDIPRAVREARRVLRPGGKVIANELYTHSSLQRIRESRFVSDFLYRRMVRFIYRTSTPYVTEDEHKIDDAELAIVTEILASDSLDQRFFSFLRGRVLPIDWQWAAKFDRTLLNMIGPAGRFLAGRVVLAGTVAK
jgi:ubiquinone/menaquinone biosynthesis C-methylase UbiE